MWLQGRALPPRGRTRSVLDDHVRELCTTVCRAVAHRVHAADSLARHADKAELAQPTVPVNDTLPCTGHLTLAAGGLALSSHDVHAARPCSSPRWATLSAIAPPVAGTTYLWHGPDA